MLGRPFDMMRPAFQQEAGQLKVLPRGGVPERPKEQTVNLPSSTSFESFPTTTISSFTSKYELPLVGFPSGQREQTVNLPSSTSKVRILPHHHHSRFLSTHSAQCSIFLDAGSNPSLPVFPVALRLPGLQNRSVGWVRRSRHPASARPPGSGIKKNPECGVVLIQRISDGTHNLIFARQVLHRRTKTAKP